MPGIGYMYIYKYLYTNMVMMSGDHVLIHTATALLQNTTMNWRSGRI